VLRSSCGIDNGNLDRAGWAKAAGGQPGPWPTGAKELDQDEGDVTLGVVEVLLQPRAGAGQGGENISGGHGASSSTRKAGSPLGTGYASRGLLSLAARKIV
jgi:hypothetical protein